MARILAIADTQHPFDHVDYLKFLKAVARKYKTKEVVHVGDLVDHHALSDFVHDPDGFSAGHELIQAKARLKSYYNAFPNVKVCIGNHDHRIYRRAMGAGIPRAYLRGYNDFLDAPKGWRFEEKWEIDGVIYKHGEGYSGANGAINAAKDELRSCVIGHLHSDAGVLYWANSEVLLFGMNVGSGIDRKSYAFAYGKVMRRKPIISCGVVIDGIATLVPMILNKRGRWNGKV